MPEVDATDGTRARGDGELSREHPHCVYLAGCANGSIYTGYSRDVERRIARHNAGRGGSYTRANRPLLLLAVLPYATRTEALAAERRMKTLPRSKKLALIDAVQAGERVGP